MSDSEFASFDEALKKLELEEEDLKRLISAGEIRAFREGSNMRLRVEDVSKVAEQLGMGGSVAEEDAGEVLEIEDLVLDEAEDEGMATTQLSEEDTLLDDSIEELEVAEEAPGSAAGRRAGVAATSRRAAVAVVGSDEGGGMRAAIIVTTLLMLFGIAFAIGMVSGQKSGITAGVVDMVHGK